MDNIISIRARDGQTLNNGVTHCLKEPQIVIIMPLTGYAKKVDTTKAGLFIIIEI